MRILSFSLFYCIQAFNGLNGAHPLWGGWSALLSLLIPMLIPPRNIFTDTPTINIYTNIWAPHGLVTLTKNSSSHQISHFSILFTLSKRLEWWYLAKIQALCYIKGQADQRDGQTHIRTSGVVSVTIPLQEHRCKAVLRKSHKKMIGKKIFFKCVQRGTIKELTTKEKTKELFHYCP